MTATYFVDGATDYVVCCVRKSLNSPCLLSSAIWSGEKKVKYRAQNGRCVRLTIEFGRLNAECFGPTLG